MRRVRDGWILLATVLLLAASFTSFFDWNRLRVDATAYWDAGTRVRTGAALYATVPVAALDKAYLYPPAFAAAFAPLTMLSPLSGYATWMALELLFAIALARVAAALAGLDDADEDARRAALALALALGLVPVIDNLVEGQVNLLVATLAALAVLDAERGRDRRAAFALAAATHVKLVPIVLAAAFAVWRRWRLLGWLAVALVVVALAPLPWRVATLGVGGGVAAFGADYADFWHRILWPGASAHQVAGVEQLFAPNFSFRGTLSRLFVAGVALSPFPALAGRRGPLLAALPAPAVAAASALLGLGALLVALWLCRRSAAHRAGRVTAAGLVLLAGAVASPSFWPHHFVMATVTGAGLWRLLADQPAPRRARLWTIVATPFLATLTLPYFAARASNGFDDAWYRAIIEYGLPTAAVVELFVVAAVTTARTARAGVAPFRRRPASGA